MPVRRALFTALCSFVTSYAMEATAQVSRLMVSAYDNVVQLDFSTAPPTVLYTGVGGGFEGTAHAEDINGNLIFWVQATGIFDANNTLMPGSVGMFANPSSAEINICPIPGDPDRYYVLYNAETCSGLYYSIVDMTLNGGLGDVVELNTPIDQSASYSEGLEIIRIPCTDSLWFMAFDCNAGLVRFSVTTAGINNGTLLQNFLPPGGYDGRGELDYHQGRLGMAFAWTNTTFWAEFDPATGELSDFNSLAVGPAVSCYGLEFSPDGTYGFVSSWYDMSGSDNFFVVDPAAGSVVGSHVLSDDAGNASSLGEIELGPDGNLYMAMDFSNAVKVIHNANTPATLSFSEIATTSQIALGMDDPIQSDLSGIVIDPGVIEVDPFIPNVFSPNGDEYNDRFKVGNVIPELVSYHLMMVYNRWGREVHRSTNVEQGWDGRINGVDAADGVYFYFIDLSYSVVGCHGEPLGSRTIPRQEGWVQLVR